MKRLAARLLTRLVRRFQAVLSRLLGRRRRKAADGRVRLFLAPVESRDHTGNLVGGLVGAALGGTFTDPLEQMALAVGDFALLSLGPAVPPESGSGGAPSSPVPLASWLGDAASRPLPDLPHEPESGGSAGGAAAGEEAVLFPAGVFGLPPLGEEGDGAGAAHGVITVSSADTGLPPGSGGGGVVTASGGSPFSPTGRAGGGAEFASGADRMSFVPAPTAGPRPMTDRGVTVHGSGSGPPAPTPGAGETPTAGGTAPTPGGPEGGGSGSGGGVPLEPGRGEGVRGSSGPRSVLPGESNAGKVPGVLVVAPDPTASETGPSKGLFRVSRVGPTDDSLDVYFRVEGTATNTLVAGSGGGEDYKQLYGPSEAGVDVWLDEETGEVLGKLTLTPGKRAVTLTVAPVDDSVDDPDEVVDLVLLPSPDRSYSLDRLDRAAVTIDDNDGYFTADVGPSGWYGPVVSIRAADPHVAEEGGTAAFEVRRTGPTDEPLRVYYTVLAKSTAGEGKDYHGVETRYVDLAVGQSRAPVVIDPEQDKALEGDETVWVRLAPPPGTIGDRVWEDLDGNGLQDSGEPGVAGVTVTLYDLNYGPPQTTTTDGFGYYWFTGLAPGRYYAHFEPPTPFKFTTPNAGDDDSINSHADSAGFTEEVWVGDERPGVDNIDAGVFRTVTEGGVVWEDVNGDGLRQGGEAGAGPWLPVTLYRWQEPGGWQWAGETSTQEDGSYTIEDVAPGKYSLRFTAPSGKAFTARWASGATSSDDGVDLDSDPAGDGKTGAFTVKSGADRFDLDAGVLSGVGDFVWEDANANGVQDAGEKGIPGVQVELTLAGSSESWATTTDADGTYWFPYAFPGTYYLQFTSPSSKHYFSPQGKGGNPAADSDPGSDGKTPEFAIGYPYGDATHDAGLYQLGTITDRVWTDTNGNGIQDPHEQGVAGVTVNLRAPGGGLVSSTGTDTSGVYTFSDIVPGDYYLEFVPPSGSVEYAFTRPFQGDDLTKDSDADQNSHATAVFGLASGKTVTGLAAGVYLPVTVGDYVWEDADANGEQGPEEKGVDGVSVTLSRLENELWVPIDWTETKDGGEYKFVGVAPGDYSVTFDLLDGYAFTTRHKAGVAPSEDSDAGKDGSTGSFPVTSGVGRLDIDAGLVTAIGDYVWEDVNGDGHQDDDEPGLAGVTVTLERLTGGEWVAVGNPLITDATGKYSFTGMGTGEFRVRFERSGFEPAPDDDPDPERNSDPDPATGVTAPFTTGGGPGRTDIDAGLFEPASVAKRVWNDLDKDGYRSGSEPPVPNVTVRLFDDKGNLVREDKTNTAGEYELAGLSPGTYRVEFVRPNYFAFTKHRTDTPDDRNSDPDPDTGLTGWFTLKSRDHRTDIDAGLVEVATASVCGRVWLDSNANGLQESTEPGIPGLTVRLLGAAGNLVTSEPTQSDGSYSFTDLASGDYTVKVVATDTVSPRQAWPDKTKDSDAFADATIPEALAPGQQAAHEDVGLYVKGTISGRVWEDQDGNGLRDDGEPPVQGVTVTLYDANQNPVGNPYPTGSDGTYSFPGLVPATYRVGFALPSDLHFTRQVQGFADKDSDVIPGPSPGKTALIPLVSGDNKNRTDAGVYTFGGLGDRVWEDTNGNGFQDEDETFTTTGTTTVTLYKPDGTTETKPVVAGHYSFTDLAPGDYTARFVLPAGYVFTRRFPLNPDSKDSDVPRDGDGTTVTVRVRSGRTNNDVDAGVFKLGGVGDCVWHDADGDGFQGYNEPPVVGVPVTLIDAWSGKTWEDVSKPDGSYSFADVLPGEYYVRFAPSSDWRFTRRVQNFPMLDSDVIPGNDGKTGLVKVVSGKGNDDVDAGLYHPATISDWVWEDADGDGKQGDAEHGLAGVTVSLYDDQDELVAELPNPTGSDGAYKFPDLIPGSYRAEFNLPTGYYFTKQVQGFEDKDSNVPRGANPGKTNWIHVVSGEVNDRTDAGAYLGATIQGKEWVDTDGNGTWSAGEPKAPQDLPVYLYVGQAVLATTKIRADGTYSFPGLPAGASYVVKFALPSATGYGFTRHLAAPLVGNSDVLDNNGGKTGTVAVAYGGTTADIDAGYFQLASITGRAWEDFNANGLQDPDPDGIAVPVTVTLRKAGGAYVTQQTATAGYTFPDLAPGDYYLEFSQPGGYYFTTKKGPGFETVDSDVDPSAGQTGTIQIRSGVSKAFVDAGLYQLGYVGDYVWEDTDGDGKQGTDEHGVPGVEVYLCAVAGGPVAPMATTDANGKLTLGPVRPGVYQVSFHPPTGWLFTQYRVGPDDLDNDAVMDPLGWTTAVPVTSGKTNKDVDAGIYKGTAIRGRAWEDTNGNWVRDAGDKLLAGANVSLYNSSGAKVETKPTDGAGAYAFLNYLPGEYKVGFELPTAPAQYYFTKHLDGPPAANSDVLDGTTQTGWIDLESGGNEADVDAGMFRLGKLGNQVWEDKNGNGLLDDGACAASGVSVSLYNSAGGQIWAPPGLSVTTQYTTGSDGLYWFNDLPPGEYKLSFNPPSGSPQWYFTKQVPGNKAFDSDVIPGAAKAGPWTGTVKVESGKTNDTVDAGLYHPASIGDRVWVDTDGDHKQTTGEPGLAGVTVQLYQGGAPFGAPFTTVSDGLYTFGNLAPGDYQLKYTLPAGAGYVFTAQVSGYPETDSDADPATGMTAAVPLTSGDVNTRTDAGAYKLVSVGDWVWEDYNGDGLQDGPQYGRSGIVVRLCGTNLVPLANYYATTDATGHYAIPPAPPGTYALQFQLPSGWWPTRAKATGNAANDSDVTSYSATGLTGTTGLFAITSGQSTVDLDAGLVRPVTIGDYVWYDSTTGGTLGIQDAWDVPVANGASVSVYYKSQLVATTPVLSNGKYSYTALPGEYDLQFNPPASANYTYAFSPQFVGNDPWVDSDANAAGVAHVVVTSGEVSNPFTDAGIVRTAVPPSPPQIPPPPAYTGAIGDWVWWEKNGNSTQEPSVDKALAGVKVELALDKHGTWYQWTTTDGSGGYQFNHLAPGTYYLHFITPSGWAFVTHDVGGNDVVDSDAYETDDGWTDAITVGTAFDRNVDAGLYPSNFTNGASVPSPLGPEGGGEPWIGPEGPAGPAGPEPYVEDSPPYRVGEENQAVITILDDDSKLVFSDTELTPGRPILGNEGAPTGERLLATFTDEDTARTAEDYAVTVDWGDGQKSDVTPAGGAGLFEVKAGHAYDEPGSYVVSVAATALYRKNPDVHTSEVVYRRTATGRLTAAIDGEVVLQPTTLAGEVCEPLPPDQRVVALFTSDDPTVVVRYTPEVYTGDGGGPIGGVTVEPDPSGGSVYRVVVPGYEYHTVGTYTPVVLLRDPTTGLVVASCRSTMTVTDPEGPPLPDLRSYPTAVGEGQPVADWLVAAFGLPEGVSLEDISAELSWGDGTEPERTTPVLGGTVVRVDAPPPAHDYPAGVYGVTVTIRVGAADPVRVGTTVVVAAKVNDLPPLQWEVIQRPAGVTNGSGEFRVATITSAPATARGGEYRAWITWGDGTASAGGVYGSGDTLWVGGNHPYADTGHYLATVVVWQDGNPGRGWVSRTEVRVVDMAEGDEYPPRTVGVVRVEPANTLDDLRDWVGWDNGDPQLLDFGGLGWKAEAEAVLGVPGYDGPAFYYDVTAGHAPGVNGVSSPYPDAGEYDPTAEVQKDDTSEDGTWHVSVAEAPLSVAPDWVPPAEPGWAAGQSIGQVTALEVIDPAPSAKAELTQQLVDARYWAVVDWGDGSTDALGKVTQTEENEFSVSTNDDHRYAAGGEYLVSVYVRRVTPFADGRAGTLLYRFPVTVAPGEVTGLQAWQRRSERDNATWVPAGPDGEVSPNTGAVRLFHPLDFDASPGTAVGRDPHLVYNSDTADPRPVIEAAIPVRALRAAGATVDYAEVVLSWDKTPSGQDIPDKTVTVIDPLGSDPNWLVDIRPDVPFDTSGVARWHLTVTLYGLDGSSVGLRADGDAQVVVNTKSPFGAGWWVDELWRVVPNADGKGGALMVYGTGESRYFRNQEGSTFVSPPEDFGVLRGTCEGYAYRSKYGEEWHFDPTGKLTEIVDRNGLATRFGYAGGALSAVTAVDGNVVTVSYDGESGLPRFTESGQRQVTVSFNNGTRWVNGITVPLPLSLSA
jgi:5-hydroxyisourate hydrolase-like protein (transthyretin family)